MKSPATWSSSIRLILAATLLVVVSLSTNSASAQGPDVIVADLPSVAHYGPVGGIHAYAVGTTSCNLGDAPLNWFSNTNQHPVITQNVYRLANGRFEQIGQGWLKHGFCALSGTLCGPCQSSDCDTLGVGCSDPYSASLNGSQGGLGPKSDITAATGSFSYPFTDQGSTGDAIYKRIQVAETDLTVPGAQYFVASHYVTPDEPPFGTDDNNESYREVTVSGSFELNVSGPTVREKYAIEAWSDNDAGVTITIVDVPNGGRFIVGAKAILVSGSTYRYEYAIQNFTSDRAADGFSVPLPSGAVATNLGFHDVDCHSGEPYDNTDWNMSASATEVSWTSPQTYAQNVNANALRWDTIYSMWFETDAPPVAGTATLDLFVPGTPSILNVATTVPGDPSSPPFNDDCANALAVSAGTTPFSTANATTDGPAEGSCPVEPAADVWFRYTAPCDGDAVFSLCGSGFDTVLAVYMGACPSGSAAVACNNDFCAGQSEITLPVTLNTEYWLRIGGAGGAEGTGTLTVTDPNCGPPPGSDNDNCADAVPLTDGIPVMGSTTGANSDGTASCANSANSPDVWYTYTPSVSETVTISTCNNASYDTALAIFDGCGGAQLACLDDTSGCAGFTQSLDYAMTAGVTYWIRVSGYQNASGDFTLTVTGGGGGAPSGPSNDDCANRQGVGLGTLPFDTTGATTDGPTHALCLGSGDDNVGSDIWYNYPSTFTGQITISLCGSSYDTKLAVYDDGGCADYETRLMACNDDSCGLQSEITIDVVPSRNYTIRVGGYNGATGTGTLTITGMPDDSCSLVTTGLVQQLETDTGLSTSGASVTSWTDQSGSSNDLVAVGAPMLLTGGLNGQDIVSFDGSDDALMRTTGLNGFASGNADRTVMTVVRYLGTGVGGVSYGDSACNAAFGGVVDAQGELAVDVSCGTYSSPSLGTGAGWLVQTVVHQAGTLSHFQDSALIDSTSSTLATVNTQMVVGADVGMSSFASMEVAAILVWDRALTAMERAQSEGYLFVKYFGETCGDNHPPIVNDDMASVDQGQNVVIDVLINDFDEGAVDASTVMVESAAANGTTSVNATTGAITYTHDDSATTSDSFTYSVRDDSGALSPAATVQVTIVPCTSPSISSQPSGGSLCEGGSITLSVSAGGQKPLAYQWRRNGADLPGENGTTLSLNSVTTADDGSYTVVVSNVCGSLTSQSATVTVAAAPAVTSNPASQSSCEGGTVTLSVIASGANPLTYQWRRNGVNVGTNASTLTLSSLSPGDAGNYDVVVSNSCGTTTSSVAMVMVDALPTILSQPSGATVCEGANVTLSVSASGAAPLGYQWRRNGVNVAGANGSSLVLNGVDGADAGSYDVLVSNSCDSVTSAAAVVVVNEAPLITQQPGNQSGCEGSLVTLSVSATGTGPLSYQWRRNGVNVAGGNAATLTIPSLSVADAGSYDVVVSNLCDSATSTTANVTVSAAPSIVADPTDQLSCEGGTVTLTVSAVGTGPLQYQWRRNGVSLGSGAMGSSLVLSSITPADAGTYDVLVMNTCGSAVSAGALVTVDGGTGIVIQPMSQNPCEGATINLSVGAVGASLAYQWRKDGVNVAGANGPQLSISNLTASDSGTYDVTVMGSCGSITSDPAIVSVGEAPAILSGPQSVGTCEGFDVTFTVVVDSALPVDYEWRQNGALIPGETLASLQILGVTPADAGDYTVTAISACGMVSSAAATLSVTAQDDCDCNANGILDGDELTAGSALDCNSNGRPDECDIAGGTSLDGNSNGIPDECEVETFIRSDVNQDGVTNIADPIGLLAYLFTNGNTPLCLDAADTNDDSNLDVGDVVLLLEWQFNNGAAFPAPFPACGVDPTADSITCNSFNGCP